MQDNKRAEKKSETRNSGRKEMSDYSETDFTWGSGPLHSLEAECQWQVTVAGLMRADSVGVCFNLSLSNSGTMVFSCHHRRKMVG